MTIDENREDHLPGARLALDIDEGRACLLSRMSHHDGGYPPTRALLVEYQKAQDSAEHHDGLVWTVTSLNWVGSAVLMGFVISGIGAQPDAKSKIALLAISVVGFLLSCLVWRWVRQLRALKGAKYKRCQQIEELFDMHQHRDTNWPTGKQTREYALLMTVFLAAWVLLAVLVVLS